MTSSKNFNFKENIAKLEDIVKALETNGDIEESIKKYKQGVKIIEQCQSYLTKMKNEIKIIKGSLAE